MRKFLEDILWTGIWLKGQGPCCQAWQPMFDPQNPHCERRESTPSDFLWSQHMCCALCSRTKQIKVFKKDNWKCCLKSPFWKKRIKTQNLIFKQASECFVFDESQEGSSMVSEQTEEEIPIRVLNRQARVYALCTMATLRGSHRETHFVSK